VEEVCLGSFHCIGKSTNESKEPMENPRVAIYDWSIQFHRSVGALGDLFYTIRLVKKQSWPKIQNGRFYFQIIKMEIGHFHFEVLHFSTSILGFLHFSQGIYAGFYKVVDPNDMPNDLPLRRIFQLVNEKGPIGEFIGLSNQMVLLQCKGGRK
jgi:hypothetical protein